MSLLLLFCPRFLLYHSQDAVCRRAESEALACPQGRRASGGPGSGEGTGAEALRWPRAGVGAGQLVVRDLAGQNKLSEHQHIHRTATLPCPHHLLSLPLSAQLGD